MKNFGLLGAAGFVAPRHMRAIRETGNNLVVALDPHDSVGILDEYFPDAAFFTETELFSRFVGGMQQKAKNDDERIHFISICTPNYLHDSHIYMALNLGANAICEKPLTTDSKNLDKLIELELKTGYKIYTLLQLRLHPSLLALKQRIEKSNDQRTNVVLTYITRRGKWYQASWKGSAHKSGGLAMNIGIHFFDVLIWLFGNVEQNILQLSQADKMAGVLRLEKATICWYLSIDQRDLPTSYLESGKYSFRHMSINGDEVDFSEGFTSLHTMVYRDIMLGRGLGVQDARPSLEVVQGLNCSEVSPIGDIAHPYLTASAKTK